ncbi:kinase-like protein [Eremomyces bilateralis CBS 781.70]|uniref:Kinase-like protein n=1 Tax=Eremomyces bilateralis CBS 781.70 TaxID=1392243 RepID=A0A6G1FV84_9PEZI|nr:kinase-like protein [Eremomyces bilateralis CBS 781.70]KAF1809592.1 kinase-like protein [Eremomyces bilateralis CBS 781.70]
MHTDFHEDRLHDYTDDELARYIVASPRIEPISSVFLLSRNLLAKHYKPPLAEDTVKAIENALQLGIPAPRIQRVVQYNGNAYCIIDRIQGTTLEAMWTKLGWLATANLALQLRRSIHLMRSITSTTAGSLATGECRSFWLEDRYGLPARASPKDITYFIRFWAGFISIRTAMKAATQGSVNSKCRIPSRVDTLVFTHHDLAPRNILLDPSGRLWLIDWDYAGFYPIFFEYASIHNFHIPQNWGFFARLRWNLFVWAAAGRYRREASVLEQIRWKFTRWPVGRRFELLQNGGPSRRPAS